jgi:hypothetical protein
MEQEQAAGAEQKNETVLGFKHRSVLPESHPHRIEENTARRKRALFLACAFILGESIEETPDAQPGTQSMNIYLSGYEYAVIMSTVTLIYLGRTYCPCMT